MSTVAAVGLATLAGAGILPAAAEPGAMQLAANHLVNPCAAKNPCAAANPCAANPCAPKKAN